MPRFVKQLPSTSRLRELLEYDPVSGHFTWKRRVSNNNAWNTRYSGKPAGSMHTLGYIVIRIDGTDYYAHRIAWAMFHGSCETDIDHVNGGPTDNRISNLRAVTHAQNLANRRSNRDKILGLPKGVFFERGRYKAAIRKEGTLYYLGLHDSVQEAHYAYALAARSLFGRYARV